MAIVAKVRSLLFQQLVVIPAMGDVAAHAIFRNWGMLVQERAALFGVALVAEIVDGVGFQALAAERSMRVMTIAAGNLAFLDRMVGLSAGFRLDIFVAGEAQLRLRHLQILGQAGVAGMAAVARKSDGLVLARLPKGKMLGITMTGKALCGLCCGISLLAESKSTGSFAAAFLQVGSHAGAVTSKAGASAVGAGNSSFGMAGFHEAGELVCMAVFTRLSTWRGGLGTVDKHPRAGQSDHPRDQGKH